MDPEGEATKIGNYPSKPGLSLDSAVLTANDELIWLGYSDDESAHVVWRFTTAGSSEALYTEDGSEPLDLYEGRLITGP